MDRHLDRRTVAKGAGPAEAALTTPLEEAVAMARSLVWEKKP